MLRDKILDTATRLGIKDHLRNIREALPMNKQTRTLEQNMRLLLKSILTEHSNCIDVGAYRGNVLMDVMQIAPHGKHIAYEPQPERYKELVRRFPSIDIRMAALSNVEGETSFICVKNMPGYSGFHEISYPKRAQLERLTVKTQVLDRSLPDGYAPAFIKIDVEGAEGLVIEGAIETITKYKPLIVFEHGKAAVDHYQTSSRHVYELLHDGAGLQIFDFDGNGPYSLQQFEETCALDERWDYIARV